MHQAELCNGTALLRYGCSVVQRAPSTTRRERPPSVFSGWQMESAMDCKKFFSVLKAWNFLKFQNCGDLGCVLLSWNTVRKWSFSKISFPPVEFRSSNFCYSRVSLGNAPVLAMFPFRTPRYLGAQNLLALTFLMCRRSTRSAFYKFKRKDSHSFWSHRDDCSSYPNTRLLLY